MLTMFEQRDAIIAPLDGKGYSVYHVASGGVYQILFGDSEVCRGVVLLNKVNANRLAIQHNLNSLIHGKMIFPICKMLLGNGWFIDEFEKGECEHDVLTNWFYIEEK